MKPSPLQYCGINYDEGKLENVPCTKTGSFQINILSDLDNSYQFLVKLIETLNMLRNLYKL